LKDFNSSVAKPLSAGEAAGAGRAAALLVATTWWPLSARLAMRWIQHGGTVSALCPRGHVLQQITGMGPVYPYHGRDPMLALEQVICRANPDIIIPCDDRAVWLLHALYERAPHHRSLIESSLGTPAHYAAVRSRPRFMAMADQIGLRVPENYEIGSRQELQAALERFSGTAVLKLDGTTGGNGVQIIRSLPQGFAAWRKLTGRPLPGVACKRRLINHDPLAFWRGLRQIGATVSLQRFIPGRPANAMLACWRGEVLGIVTVEVLGTQGPTGASTIVRLIQNDEIVDIGRAVARVLGLSGFYGLDFMLEEASGHAYLIELNARCTQLGHLSLPAQGDLAGLLCARLAARPTQVVETPIATDLIAFFPQALCWDPHSAYLPQCYLDVPWAEPGLVRELLREDWPERQWLGRVYHFLRRRKGRQTVIQEALQTGAIAPQVSRILQIGGLS
jgi:hypothetical protein